MDIPPTLHGQLYLLDYDRQRHRFAGNDLLGYTLAAAMLTDLHLNGYLLDEDGTAHPVKCAAPADPLLGLLVGLTAPAAPKDWGEWIYDLRDHARQAVRDQLTAHCWIRVQRRAASIRLRPTDEATVDHTAGLASLALRHALHGPAAEPRPLAVGLLAVLGQLPTLRDFTDDANTRHKLQRLTLTASAPITALHTVIQTHYEGLRAGMGGGIT